jgi:dephospho-CoA kinase
MGVLRVGLTGGLGAGKSTVGRALAARGAFVVDTDQVARDVLAPGSVGERAVLDRFGPSVAAPDGALDRRALALAAFAGTEPRLALEAITHPLIEQEVARRVASCSSGIVVIELPLLNGERRSRYSLDAVVLVETPEEVAVERAVTQRGMASGDVRARLAAQPSAADRRAAADWVVVNAGGPAELEVAVDELWAWLAGLARAARGGHG